MSFTMSALDVGQCCPEKVVLTLDSSRTQSYLHGHGHHLCHFISSLKVVSGNSNQSLNGAYVLVDFGHPALPESCASDCVYKYTIIISTIISFFVPPPSSWSWSTSPASLPSSPSSRSSLWSQSPNVPNTQEKAVFRGHNVLLQVWFGSWNRNSKRFILCLCFKPNKRNSKVIVIIGIVITNDHCHRVSLQSSFFRTSRESQAKCRVTGEAEIPVPARALADKEAECPEKLIWTKPLETRVGKCQIFYTD